MGDVVCDEAVESHHRAEGDVKKHEILDPPEHGPRGELFLPGPVRRRIRQTYPRAADAKLEVVIVKLTAVAFPHSGSPHRPCPVLCLVYYVLDR